MSDILTKYEKPVDPLSPVANETKRRNQAILNYVKKNKIPRNQIGQIIYNNSDKKNPIRIILKKDLDSKGNIKNKKTQKVIRDKKAIHDKEVEAMRKEMNMGQSAEDAFKELAEKLYGTGNVYSGIQVFAQEGWRLLEPGGLLVTFSYAISDRPSHDADLIACWGIYQIPNVRNMTCLNVWRKRGLAKHQGLMRWTE